MSAPPDLLIEADSLAKSFGKIAALRGVCFGVRRGQVHIQYGLQLQ